MADVTQQTPEVYKQTIKAYEDFWSSLEPESALICRHEIGPHPTRLCAMDWYKGGSPWNSNSQRKKKGNGTWAIEVTQSGRYRFELSHYSLETQKVIGATEVELRLGNTKVTGQMTADDYSAVMELDLKAGTYDMDTLFSDNRGNKWGSLFAYITLIK